MFIVALSELSVTPATIAYSSTFNMLLSRANTLIKTADKHHWHCQSFRMATFLQWRLSGTEVKKERWGEKEREYIHIHGGNGRKANRYNYNLHVYVRILFRDRKFLSAFWKGFDIWRYIVESSHQKIEDRTYISNNIKLWITVLLFQMNTFFNLI